MKSPPNPTVRLSLAPWCGLIVALVFLVGRTTGEIFDTNLLVNPGAEAGPSTPNGDSLVPIPGWLTNGGATVLSYDLGNDFPSYMDPGPEDRGVHYFAGGQFSSNSSISQVVDLAGVATLVDNGEVKCELSGYLGGYVGQEDNAVLTACFEDSTTNALGSIILGPVTADDRTNNTGLFYRGAVADVPGGTRSILVTLTMNRLEGGYNDGYADNLSLVLRSARPQLVIRDVQNQARLSWPTNAVGYWLETAIDPTQNDTWTNCPEIPVVVGDVFVVTNEYAVAQRYFRLRK